MINCLCLRFCVLEARVCQFVRGRIKICKMSRIIGPALPPSLCKDNNNSQTVSSDSEEDFYGPALPSHLKSKPAPEEENPTTSMKPEPTIKMVEKDDSSDDEIIGPLPIEGIDVDQASSLDIEQRALSMKRKLLGLEDSDSDKQPQREDWMIELPELHRKNFGLGPRTFNRTNKPECTGRDQWTSTPSTKASTSKAKVTNTDEELRKQYFEHKRNEQLDEIVSKHDKVKKRSVSLLQAHQKELKKKKTTTTQPKERKPFDRDEDLKLNKLDDAKRRALIKKSQELNSKFKTGNQKFL